MVGGIQPSSPRDVLLQVEGLEKHFPQRGGWFRGRPEPIRAVDGVSFEVAAGETLGLVGESGSGKSTLARTLLQLEEPSAGSIRFEGRETAGLSSSEFRPLRRSMQMIFQDPFSSLNPRRKVGDLIIEAWRVNPGTVPRDEWRDRAQDLLHRVGLKPDHIDRYPNAFSGGQRQRIGIARALALNPKLVICDEAVSALDVSIQAQVVNLLKDIQEEFGLSYIFIAHDLGVVRQIADRVAVMYLGKIVETGTETEVFDRPTHPYTRALLSAVPSLMSFGERTVGRIRLDGEIPSAVDPPSGCRFRTRCWKAEPICADEVPELRPRIGSPHPSACHFAEG